MFKFEETITSYGQTPGPGIDPKVPNDKNLVANRHKLLKFDTRGICMARNSIVISIVKFDHAFTSGIGLKREGHVLS